MDQIYLTPQKQASAELIEKRSKFIGNICHISCEKEALEYIKQQDEVTYTIVKALGFLNICDSNFKFLMPNLEKLYREISQNIQQQEVLPDKLKSELLGLRDTLQANALKLVSGDYYD